MIIKIFLLLIIINMLQINCVNKTVKLNASSLTTTIIDTCRSTDSIVNVTYGLWIDTVQGKGGLLFRCKHMQRVTDNVLILLKDGSLHWELYDSSCSKNDSKQYSGMSGGFEFMNRYDTMTTNQVIGRESIVLEFIDFDTLQKVFPKSAAVYGEVDFLLLYQEKRCRMKITIGNSDVPECLDIKNSFQ